MKGSQFLQTALHRFKRVFKNISSWRNSCFYYVMGGERKIAETRRLALDYITISSGLVVDGTPTQTWCFPFFQLWYIPNVTFQYIVLFSFVNLFSQDFIILKKQNITNVSEIKMSKWLFHITNLWYHWYR